MQAPLCRARPATSATFNSLGTWALAKLAFDPKSILPPDPGRQTSGSRPGHQSPTIMIIIRVHAGSDGAAGPAT